MNMAEMMGVKTSGIEKTWSQKQPTIQMKYREDDCENDEAQLINIVPLRVITGIRPTTGAVRYLLVAYNPKVGHNVEYDMSYFADKAVV